MNDKKVVIVGAGIVGLSTAYFLSKKGVQVDVIDSTDGKDNCSYGNAGYISPSHIIPLSSPGIINQGLKWMLNPESPFYIKPRLNRDLMKWGWLFKKASTQKRVDAAAPVLNELTVRSQRLYEIMIADEGIEAGYENQGLLMVCQTKEALHHEIEAAKLANSFGLDAGPISREEVERMEPDVQYNMAGAVYFGCDSWLTPQVFMKALKQKLDERGVTIHYNTTVEKLVLQGASIDRVITNKGEFFGDEYVMAAGSWTPEILKQIKVNIPLQAGKGYSLTLPDPVVKPKYPSILVEGRIATTPMLNSLRFAGTMEVSGTQLNVNQRRIDGIVKAIKEFMPQFEHQDFSRIKPWAGLRPCTPDGLPYIGRTKRYKNLLVGTGHAMLGLTLGPITGQLLSQEIIGEQQDYVSSLLEVERYA